MFLVVDNPPTKSPWTPVSSSTDWQVGCPFPDTLANDPKNVGARHTSRDPQDTQCSLPAGIHLGSEVCGHRHSRVSLALVPPAVSTLSVAALVEGGHRLVCRAGLKLHEIGTRVFTFGTRL